MISTRISPIALAVSSAIVLTACGGGGGGGSSSTTANPTSVTVTPSLGKFTTGCAVEIRKGDQTGELLSSKTINENGTVTVTVTGYSGPIIAQVKGSDSCTYYDEGRRVYQPFGIGQTLSAVVPEVRTELSINVLTNLAAARVLNGDKLATGKTETEINRENTTVQQMFQVGDMFSAPTLIGSPDDKFDNTEAGKLAAKLAALAELAKNKGGIAAFSKALADDLKDDGNLNTVAIDAAQLRTALQTAVDNYAKPADKPALDTLDDDTELKTTIDQVKDQVDRIAAAGTALQQAKQIFADLRTSIMSVSNDAGTGSLDKQNAQLQQDFQHGADIGQTISSLSLMVEASQELFLGGATTVGDGFNKDGFCEKISDTQAQCWFYSSELSREYLVTLTVTGANTVQWTVTEDNDPSHGYAPRILSGLTGTLSLSGSTTMLSGNFYPMTGDAEKTSVALSFTYSGSKGAQVWGGSGTLNSLKADGSSTLKFEATEVAINEVQKTAKFVAVLTSPNHRFNGTLEFSGENRSKDGQSSPKNGKLVGSFTNTATNFKLLEGTLTAALDWSNVDFTQEQSATNFESVGFGFKGTAYKEANVVGVGVDIAVSNPSYVQRTATLSFTGTNGLQITGTGTETRTAEGKTPSTWTLANSNGITATYDNGTKSGKVLKADGSTLGTISNQRVTFIDGTFESLI